MVNPNFCSQRGGPTLLPGLWLCMSLAHFLVVPWLEVYIYLLAPLALLVAM